MFAVIFNLTTNALIIVLRATDEVELRPFTRFVTAMGDDLAERGVPTWSFIHHRDLDLEKDELKFVGEEKAALIRNAVGA